jgi:hypothetical protein
MCEWSFTPTDLWRWNRQSVPKRRLLIFIPGEIPRRKYAISCMLFRLAFLFEESNYPVMLILLGAGWKPLFVCVVLSAEESKVTSAACRVLIPAAIKQNKLLHCCFCGILQIHKYAFMGIEKLDIWKSTDSRTVRKSHVLSVKKVLASPSE